MQHPASRMRRLVRCALVSCIAMKASCGGTIKPVADYPIRLSESRISFKSQEDFIGEEGLGWNEIDYSDVAREQEEGAGRDPQAKAALEYYYTKAADGVLVGADRAVAGGMVFPRFQCSGNANLSRLAVEPLFVDTRRFAASVAYYYSSTWSMLQVYKKAYYYTGGITAGGSESLQASGGEGKSEPAGKGVVQLSVKQVDTFDIAENLQPTSAFLDHGTSPLWRTPSTLLKAQVMEDPPLNLGGKTAATELAFGYECAGTGQTIVQVMLTVRQAGKEPRDICLNWIKHCSVALPCLDLEDGGTFEKVISASVVNRSADFLRGATAASHNIFYVRMTKPGNLRMRLPDIFTSNTDIGDVGARFADVENNFLELTDERSRITVDYKCFKPGTMVVHMRLQRDWSAHTDIVQLRWDKVCKKSDDVVAHHGLHAFIASEAFGNRTQVVDNGVTVEGFRRPCPRPGIFRTRHKDVQHASGQYRPPPKGCYHQIPKLTVPSLEHSTRILWAWYGSEAFPSVDDSIVGYNPALMQVDITSHWDLRMSYVKYLCFAEGTGNVTVTLYSPGHPPLDFAWRKQCVAPRKPHTARNVITAPMVLSGITALTTLLGACCIIRTHWRRRSLDRSGAEDAECSSIAGQAYGGRGGDAKNEAVYHG